MGKISQLLDWNRDLSLMRDCPIHCQNDMTTFPNWDDVLTLLVHLKYLAFDKKTKTVFIPNQEIAQEYMSAVNMGGWEGLIWAC